MKGNHNMSVNKNKTELFVRRTCEHNLMVHSLLALCWAEYSGYMDLKQYLKHDADKFDDDIIDKYVIRFTNGKTKLTKSEQSYVDSAVLKHITTNNHHPEKWDRNFRKIGDIAYASKMPYKFIIEMVCDWHATAVESGEKSAKRWADDNIGKRWVFTNDQINFIYELIHYLRDFDVKQIAEVPNSTIEKEMLKLGCIKYKMTDDYKIYEHHIDGKPVYFDLPVRLKGMERAVVVCSLLSSLKFLSKYEYLLPFIKKFMK